MTGHHDELSHWFDEWADCGHALETGPGAYSGLDPNDDCDMGKVRRYVRALRARAEAAERERDRYRAFLAHNQMIVRGGPEAVLEDHERVRNKYWDKLDDDLCALCALANMVINAERERDELREALEARLSQQQEGRCDCGRQDEFGAHLSEFDENGTRLCWNWYSDHQEATP